MSQSAEAAYLLESRGTSRDLDAFVVAGPLFPRRAPRVGFALGDGTVRLGRRRCDPHDWTSRQRPRRRDPGFRCPTRPAMALSRAETTGS